MVTRGDGRGCQGHVWLLGGMRGCRGVGVVARGMCGCWGGMHGCRGHVWWLGGGGGIGGIRRDTVNEREVRILLECILVINCISMFN